MSEAKMEKDYSTTVDELIPATEKLAISGNLGQALEQLLILEKQSRSAADMVSNSRILVHIVQLCYKKKEYKMLNEQIVTLSKKHGFLKQAVTKMIQETLLFVEQIKDMKIKLELIDTIRTVTEGKIFVEVERARVTHTLAKIKESEGKINEAADILHELQVETFGSMEKREKTEFLLEQMRLCLAKKDLTRTQIISRKISIKFFEDEANQDLKLRFYDMMIQHGLYEDQFLKICKYYKHIYDTPCIQQDSSKLNQALQHIVMFVILSPHDNEQFDLLHRTFSDSNLNKVPLLKELVRCFITNELMRWPKIQEIYGQTLQSTSVFNLKLEDGVKRWKELHKRVIEHNIRVISKYYTCITMKKLQKLLDLNASDAEELLSNLVVSKTIYAKIDRPAGIINFVAPQDPNGLLNDWADNIHSLLNLIVKTNHLITKEEMVHSITHVMS